MDTCGRNVAIVSSVVYGALLCCGFFFFVIGNRGEPFYKHPSTSVAVFSVFWFSFAPSVLFMGGTVPWLCAAYGSHSGALVFAIAPGCIFVLLCAFWLFVYDTNESASFFAETRYNAPWDRGMAGLGPNVPPFRYADFNAGMTGGSRELTDMRAVMPAPAAYAAWAAHGGVPGFDDARVAAAMDAGRYPYYPTAQHPGGAWSPHSSRSGHAVDEEGDAGHGLPPLPANLPRPLFPTQAPPASQRRRLGVHYLA